MACVTAPGGPFLCRSADFLRLVFQHGIPACRRELLHPVFLSLIHISQVDALVDQAFTEMDDTKRGELVAEADKISREDYAYIPLSYGKGQSWFFPTFF